MNAPFPRFWIAEFRIRQFQSEIKERIDKKNQGSRTYKFSMCVASFLLEFLVFWNFKPLSRAQGVDGHLIFGKAFGIGFLVIEDLLIFGFPDRKISDSNFDSYPLKIFESV